MGRKSKRCRKEKQSLGKDEELGREIKRKASVLCQTRLEKVEKVLLVKNLPKNFLKVPLAREKKNRQLKSELVCIKLAQAASRLQQ